jgi:thioredoxin reductase (NADPH)
VSPESEIARPEQGPKQRPRIVAVDRDAATRALLASELDDRYGRHYDVVVAASSDEARTHLRDVADGDVALVLADRADDGDRLLAATRSSHPHATRVLLIGWNEHRSAREEIMEVLTRGDADYYVAKPTAPPDERFHRAISEFLDDWWRVRGRPFAAIQVIGDDHSPRAHKICDLLHRHDFPYAFHDVDSAAGRAALEAAAVKPTSIPVVIVDGGAPLIDPPNVEVAEALGARTRPGEGRYDVVVIGGGPAGLATAVYAGSEGLRVALVERTSMGGQAGTSSMIRNYLGFPRGISGAELARRAFDQAILFGTEMVYGGDVVAVRADSDLRVVELADGTTLITRAVVVATGVAYRTLDVPSLEAFNGVGVHYGSAMSEARALTGEHACVVGGGNSAGQAAMHLAEFAKSVTIVVRSNTLAASMSDYLVKSIERTPNIGIRFETEIAGGGGDAHLEWIDLADRTTGAVERVAAAALFVLIGADPCTDWLPSSVQRDDWGYIATGGHCECRLDVDSGRAPLMFETTMPGVFSVGDVRQGSVKRVASAAGEGAVCVRLIHDYLDEQSQRG